MIIGLSELFTWGTKLTAASLWLIEDVCEIHIPDSGGDFFSFTLFGLPFFKLFESLLKFSFVSIDSIVPSQTMLRLVSLSIILYGSGLGDKFLNHFVSLLNIM